MDQEIWVASNILHDTSIQSIMLSTTGHADASGLGRVARTADDGYRSAASWG